MELNFRVSPLTPNSDEEVEGRNGWSVRVERALSARESLYITLAGILTENLLVSSVDPRPSRHLFLSNDQNSPANLLACHNPSFSVNKAECSQGILNNPLENKFPESMEPLQCRLPENPKEANEEKATGDEDGRKEKAE
ncbi:unnamed protein product [Leuciscus chuanchicus]